MKNATLTKELAKEMLKGDNPTLKAFALENYPELGDITQRVKTFEDACIELGIGSCLPPTDYFPKWMHKKVIAEYKLSVICRALNEGVIMNWLDENQAKYYVWTEVENGKLVFNSWSSSYSCTHVPSLLCVKSSELATYLGKQFINEFNDYLL